MNSGYLIVKAGSEDFDWDSYLHETGASPAPPEFFYQSQIPPDNLFQENMKLEANDPRCPRNICLATVVQLNGPRIRLRLDGTDRCNDYWVMVDCSANIHPIGYCQEKNTFLLPPFGCTESSEKFARLVKNTLKNCHRAPAEAFKPNPKEKPSENQFRPGMKLEAVDAKHPYLVSPATVKEVNDELIKIAFDGWGDKYDFSCRFDSRDIFPVGWCKKTGHPIQLPPKKISSSKSEFGGSDTASERGLTPNRTPTPGLGRNGRSNSPAEILIIEDTRQPSGGEKDLCCSSPKIASISSCGDQIWSSFENTPGSSVVEVSGPPCHSSATKRDQFGAAVRRDTNQIVTTATGKQHQLVGLQSNSKQHSPSSGPSSKHGGSSSRPSSSSTHRSSPSPSPFGGPSGGGTGSDEDQPLAKLFATESPVGMPVNFKNSEMGIDGTKSTTSTVSANPAMGLGLSSIAGSSGSNVLVVSSANGVISDLTSPAGGGVHKTHNHSTLNNLPVVTDNRVVPSSNGAAASSNIPTPFSQGLSKAVVVSASKISENFNNFNNHNSINTCSRSNQDLIGFGNQEVQEITTVSSNGSSNLNTSSSATSSPAKLKEKSVGVAKGGSKPLSKKLSPGSNAKSVGKDSATSTTVIASGNLVGDNAGQPNAMGSGASGDGGPASSGRKGGAGRRAAALGPPGWSSPIRKQRPDIVVSVESAKDMLEFTIFVNSCCQAGPVLDQYKVEYLPPSIGPGSINNLFREALQMLINTASDPKRVFNQISPNDGHYLVTADFDGTTNGRHLPFVVNSKETWIFLRHVLTSIGACPNFYSPVSGCPDCGTFEKPKKGLSGNFNTGSFVVDLSRNQDDSPDDWHSEAVRWSVDEVVDFVSRQEDPSIAAQADSFRSSEIDGKALVLLNSEMIIKYMEVKLGPALKIAHTIDRLRGIHHF